MRSMFTLIAGGLLLAGLAGGAAAHGNVGFSVSIGGPTYVPPPVYYAPPPVYYAPPPVYYAPPPVYYGPPRVYYGPPRVIYGAPRYYGHRHGHRHDRGRGDHGRRW